MIRLHFTQAMALRNKTRGGAIKIGSSEGFNVQAPSYSPLSTAQMGQMGQMGQIGQSSQMVGQMNNNLGMGMGMGTGVGSGLGLSISQRQHMVSINNLQGQIPNQVLGLQGQGQTNMYNPHSNLIQAGILGQIPGDL